MTTETPSQDCPQCGGLVGEARRLVADGVPASTMLPSEVAARRLVARLADRVVELEADREMAGRYIDLGQVLTERGVCAYEDAGGDGSDAVEADVDTRVGWVLDDLDAAEARVAALEAALGDVLGKFTQEGYPGRPCVRTHWMTVEWVARHRALLDGVTDTEEDRP